jgi:protein-S-isoprenylcysteine O-methyltransferase Ste14
VEHGAAGGAAAADAADAPDLPLSGSHLTAVGCRAVALWFLATPFVEEPWLAERYGAEYEVYRRSVPRFIRLGRR